jgi:hypothetical protein
MSTASISFFAMSGSGKKAVNFPAMQTAHECDRTLLENKPDAIIAESNAEIFPLCLKPLEVGNLLECSGGFNLFDYFLDSPQQAGVCNCGQILVKGFAK